MKTISLGYPTKHLSHLHINENTSIRVQQWLRSAQTSDAITRRVQSRRKRESGTSNNAVNTSRSQLNASQSVKDQLFNHLNGWNCLQRLYRHPCNYTLGMSLSKVTRSIMSNSQEILLLSTSIQPFIKQQSINQVNEWS